MFLNDAADKLTSIYNDTDKLSSPSGTGTGNWSPWSCRCVWRWAGWEECRL